MRNKAPQYGTQQQQVLMHASTPKKEWDASHRLKYEPFSLASLEEELMCQILFSGVAERNSWA